MSDSDDKKNAALMESIVSLCKRRGFIFQSGEIYGGLNGCGDYGPLGVTLKKNVQAAWWKYFVESRDDMHGVDAAILMNPKVNFNTYNQNVRLIFCAFKRPKKSNFWANLLKKVYKIEFLLNFGCKN